VSDDLDLYEAMLLIRLTEETIRARYFDDEMKTPCHLSIGQEAVAAGVLAALRPEDQVLGTYRSHAIYLARTRETRNFFLEMYGRGAAPAKGRAGSMHLAAPAHNLLVTSAVVGTTIPVALGAAFAFRRAKRDAFACVFFGDGAVDEGVFWESLNYACLASLPVLFVCEDNGLAIHSAAESRHGYDSISAIASQFRCHVASSDSTDPAVLAGLTREAMVAHRSTGRPAFLHFKCCRYLEHVGVNEDFAAGYRDRAEHEAWLARDPIALVRARLLESGGASADDLAAIDRRLQEEIDASVAAAQAAPFPPDEELLTDVYA